MEAVHTMEPMEVGGYKNSDRSGSYYGEDGSTDSSDLVSDLVGLAFTLGGAAIANSYANLRKKPVKKRHDLNNYV